MATPKQGTMYMFLTRALQFIREKCPRKYPELKEKCVEALGILKEVHQEIQDLGHTPELIPNLQWISNKLVGVLLLACSTKVPLLTATALDTLHKLLVYKWVRGEFHDEEDPERKLIDRVIEGVCECFDVSDVSVQLNVIKTFATAITSPVCSVHGNSLANAVRTCYNLHLLSPHHIIKATAKGTLTQMLSMIFQRLENQSRAMVERKKESRAIVEHIIDCVVTGEPVEFPEGEDAEEVEIEVLPSADEDPASDEMLFRDSLLIFRALCRLADKEPSSGGKNDATSGLVALRSKVLALELIYSILKNSGPAFQQNERFVNGAIREYLMSALLPNGLSTELKVFKLSLDVFTILALNFKDYLKGEIGVFFKDVLLQILESPNSNSAQKLVVVRALKEICSNPQTLVDIFRNYDCDISSKDLFEKTVLDLSAMAKHRYADGDDTGEHLSFFSLQSLVSIVQSLLEWSKPLLSDQGEAIRPEKEADVDDDSSMDSPAPVNLSGLEEFERVRERKRLLELGKIKFKEHSRKGVEFFIAHNFLPDGSPDSIARFFHEQEGLDLSSIGDFMGRLRDEGCVLTMHAYVDQMDFRELPIDLALRKFLNGFRLPGEGQIIDKYMEKFAEHYIVQNPEAGFANADAAFMVAYAVIMLTTDLHRSSKRTMTVESFGSMLRGLNDGADFSTEFVANIFDNIEADPIVCQDDLVVSDPHNVLNPKERAELFKTESSIVVKRGQAALRDTLKRASQFVQSDNILLVKPMFKRTWAPLLAALSLLLEKHDDERTVSLCLQGFRAAITVAGVFLMENERNTFLNALTGFTLLASHRDMQRKHVEAVGMLITLAHSDGDYLKTGWLQVLQSISQLDKLRQMRIETQRLPTDSPNRSGKMIDGENWARITRFIPVDKIDEIFPQSSMLASDAIVDFVRCLVEVSAREIARRPPSMYSLQKLVEVAAHNMGRIRLVWASIWRIMSDHFVAVGCGSDIPMAMFAINNLKQLAFQFLEKDELSNYNFQKDFLSPFLHILKHADSVEVKDMTISCVKNMIENRASNIMSGWKVIFSCLSAASADSSPRIATQGFSVLCLVRDKYFDEVSDKFFVELVSATGAYAESVHNKDINMKAIGSLILLAEHLHDSRMGEDQVWDSTEEHTRLWWPILFRLSSISSHRHVDVRTAALDALFETLKRVGHSFSEPLWKLVFSGVLRHIFDNVRYAGSERLSAEDDEWLETTCLKAFKDLIDLYAFFFDQLGFLLGDLLSLLVQCTLQDNESLAQYGSSCFLQLVMSNNSRWTPAMWDTIVVALRHMFHFNSFHDLSALVDLPEDTPDTVDDSAYAAQLKRETVPQRDESPEQQKQGMRVGIIKGKLAVQLMLIEAISSITTESYDTLSTQHLSGLLDCLDVACSLSTAVNTRPEQLMPALQQSKLGPMVQRQLLKTESESVLRKLALLQRMNSEGPGERRSIAEKSLMQSCRSVLRRVVDLRGHEDPFSVSHRGALVPVAVAILHVIDELSQEQFRQHSSSFYGSFVQLITEPSEDIRRFLQKLFLRIGRAQALISDQEAQEIKQQDPEEKKRAAEEAAAARAAEEEAAKEAAAAAAAAEELAARVAEEEAAAKAAEAEAAAKAAKDAAEEAAARAAEEAEAAAKAAEEEAAAKAAEEEAAAAAALAAARAAEEAEAAAKAADEEAATKAAEEEAAAKAAAEDAAAALAAARAAEDAAEEEEVAAEAEEAAPQAAVEGDLLGLFSEPVATAEPIRVSPPPDLFGAFASAEPQGDNGAPSMFDELQEAEAAAAAFLEEPDAEKARRISVIAALPGVEAEEDDTF